MTRYLFWIGLGAALLLVISCFIPWVTIDSKNIVISGVNARGTNFGKPGYFNLLMTIFFVLFSLIPRVWAKRANLLVVALNLAWAIRNYFLLSACRGGECPVKETGLYLLLLACGLMLASALFPPTSLREKNS